MSSYANMPNWVHPLCQLQSASHGCLECGAGHSETTCGFSRNECRDRLAMPAGGEGAGRGSRHAIHTAGPGPGSPFSGGKLCLPDIVRFRKLSTERSAGASQVPSEKKSGQEGPVCVHVDSTWLVFWAARNRETQLNWMEYYRTVLFRLTGLWEAG